MIVTIDGPAGAGKSTAARLVAERLGFEFLDTGAMYRVVAWAAMQASIEPVESPKLTALLDSLEVRQTGRETFLGQRNLSQEIRTPEVAAQVSRFASLPSVRRRLTDLQRKTVRERNVVTEGRDQGTVAFPDAECKFFLTASEEERARRRHAELTAGGKASAIEQVLADQRRRDALDSQRELAPLKAADDACVIDTTSQTLEQVVDLIVAAVRRKMPTASEQIPR